MKQRNGSPPRSSSQFSISVLTFLLTGIALAACGGPANPKQSQTSNSGIHKIKHVIVIFQENRSFDSYFGTYPGAVGIPMKNGTPTACVPDPRTGQCVKPYIDHQDINGGGPHEATASAADINGGKMNGFIKEAELGKRGCTNTTDPICTNSTTPDVMGYHVQSDIPNYWSYAQNFVLQDHMYESVHSWSFPSHLFLMSAWSADCAQSNNPESCVASLMPKNRTPKNQTPFAWTDITYLLNKQHVSWVNYLDHGAQSISKRTRSSTSQPGSKTTKKKGFAKQAGVPKIWNVLPGFTDVHQDNQLGNIQDLSQFYTATKAGSLPAVSWIFPDPADSEHPPAPVSQGQSYVTSLVNAAMQSPDWNSTAIFLTWDDWGGFYDSIIPPNVDQLGYGIRVPGLVISPYAKQGYIDHQSLSYDAYLKFIEDDFLGGQRLDPKTDGRPDSRTVVRENASLLGNLVNDFNFNQAPRSPMILPVQPQTTLISNTKSSSSASSG